MSYEDRLYAKSDYNAEKIGEGIDEERQRVLNQEYYIVIGKASIGGLIVSDIYESKEEAEERQKSIDYTKSWIYTRYIKGEKPT